MNLFFYSSSIYQFFKIILKIIYHTLLKNLRSVNIKGKIYYS